MKHPVDWSLYLVTDPGFVPANQLPELVAASISGGVTVVQLRDKHASAEAFTTQARQLQHAIGAVPLFVNDRFDIAHELGLHLHIGQNDMPYVQARATLPSHLMIGLTIENYQQWLDCVRQCHKADVRLPDVIGLGPVTDTQTKPDAPQACGVEGVAAIAAAARRLQVPSVAIGGVNEHNAQALARTDIAGLCVVSAIMGAADPAAAARNLRSIFGAYHD